MDVPIARGRGGRDMEQEEVKRSSEYLSSLLHFVLASGISKLLLYTDLLQWDRRQSEAERQSLFFPCSLLTPRARLRCQNLLKLCCWAASSSTQPPTQSYVHLYWNIDSFFKKAFSFHLHAYLCPCCVMSMALLAGTGEPPSVTLRTSMDFLSGLLLPWRFNMGESTRFLGGSVAKKTKRARWIQRAPDDSAC